MTPRMDAWMRQASSDWAVAELTAQHNKAFTVRLVTTTGRLLNKR